MKNRFFNRVLSTVAWLCVALCLLIGSVSASGGVPQEVIDATSSVVRIQVENDEWISTGSGFVITNDKSGTRVVTNAHVVEKEDPTILIWLSGSESVAARIFAIDVEKDLCVLETAVPLRATKPLALAKDDVQKGAEVFAVGYPAAADALSDWEARGSDDTTVTNGIISAIRQMTIVEYGPSVAILQINAAINSGNSGGPLFDNRGAVVGVNTYKAEESEGIYGAVAVSELKLFLEENGIEWNTVQSKAPNFLWGGLGVGVAVAILVIVIAVMRKKRSKKDDHSRAISLRAYMGNRSVPLTWEEAASLMMPVAIELRNLHENGKCHLEVSPDSIFIGESGAILRPSSNTEAMRYSSGFAAPEIYRGKNGAIASDVYSFFAILSYLITGNVPMNALERSEAEALQPSGEPESEADMILRRGMDLEPDNRYESFRNVIMALAPYNTQTAPVVQSMKVEEKNVRTKDRPKRKPISMRAVAGALVLAVVVVAGSVAGVFFTRYNKAAKYAMAGEFGQAKEALWIPNAVRKIDNQLLDYIDAGILMGDGRNAEAAEAFRAMGEYQNCAELALEADYRNAGQLAEAGQYDESIAMFLSLSEQGYKDAEDRWRDARYQQACYWLYEDRDISAARVAFFELRGEGYPGMDEMLQEVSLQEGILRGEEEKYSSAVNILQDLGNYPGAKDELKELQIKIYRKAVSLYNSGKTDDAWELFKLIATYSRSGDYLTLCQAKFGYNRYFYPNLVNEICDLLGFADADEVLVASQHIAEDFLRGQWKSSDSSYYFSIDEKGYASYNLPSINYGDYYRIENGDYLLYPKDNESNTRTMFSISVIDKNSIRIYCWKDGSTYRMFRQ